VPATKPQLATASLQLLTAAQVAQELSVNTQTVLKWIRSGELPAVKFGGRYRIQRRYLEAVLDPFATLPVAPSAPVDRPTVGSIPFESAVTLVGDSVPGAHS
jgi:excisionase family DNA binding protein